MMNLKGVQNPQSIGEGIFEKANIEIENKKALELISKNG